MRRFSPKLRLFYSFSEGVASRLFVMNAARAMGELARVVLVLHSAF
jgi:hypothetical protein